MVDTPEPDETSRSAVRAAGDRTIDQYQTWMQTNGAAHLMRAARELGITAVLREKQHTLEQLCTALATDPIATQWVLDGLVSIGLVERYGEDFALARAGHLLCQYDEDLGDSRWQGLVRRLTKPDLPSADDFRNHRARLAATQWIHTAAAMQAAEILDIGGESQPRGLRILDLGCGSAVWSAALAHQDADATILAIDEAAALESARQTADSIGLRDRFRTVESDPLMASLGEQGFDLVVLAQSLSGYSDLQASDLLVKSAAALKAGGRLVAPDFYAGPGRAGLSETLHRISIHLATPAGRVRDLRECQTMFSAAGLGSIQFTYLASSQAGMGMIVAVKP